MIYIPVSNNYSYLLATKYAEQLVPLGFSVTFIRYKSPRNFQVNENELWKTIWLEGFPYINLRRPISSFYKNIINLKQLENISFCKNDIFFVTHEYELNVLLLAKKAKKAGAIVILTDEGIEFISFLINKLFPEPIWKYRIQKFLYPLIYRDIHLIDGPFYMEDKWYDYFLLNMKMKVERNIKTVYIKNPLLDLDKKYDMDSSSIILLLSAPNDPVQVALYWDMLENLIPKLKSKFKKIYFKLHPREYTPPYRYEGERSEMLAKKYDLDLIKENVLAESIIPKYKPKYTVSTLSTSLFNSIAFGCQPIFLYQFLLLPNKKDKIFGAMDFILKELKYNFIKSLDDINPDYDCGVKKEDLFELNYTIADFVKNICIKNNLREN